MLPTVNTFIFPGTNIYAVDTTSMGEDARKRLRKAYVDFYMKTMAVEAKRTFEVVCEPDEIHEKMRESELLYGTKSYQEFMTSRRQRLGKAYYDSSLPEFFLVFRRGGEDGEVVGGCEWFNIEVLAQTARGFVVEAVGGPITRPGAFPNIGLAEASGRALKYFLENDLALSDGRLLRIQQVNFFTGGPNALTNIAPGGYVRRLVGAMDLDPSQIVLSTTGDDSTRVLQALKRL